MLLYFKNALFLHWSLYVKSQQNVIELVTRADDTNQVSRLKETIEKMRLDNDQIRIKEAAGQDELRKLQRHLRELKEAYTALQLKETESNSKKNEFEKKLELAEAETVTAKNDLKLAMKRIDDLQVAINGELDSDLDSHRWESYLFISKVS